MCLNMKKHLRIFSLVLVLVLTFTACSGKKADPSTNQKDSSSTTAKQEEKQTDKKEKVKLKYMYPLTSDYLQVVDDLNGSIVIQKLSEMFNIEFEFIHPPTGQEKEQFNLMIASNELPDMITHDFGIPNYPGGGDKAIADDNYLRLNELIESHAPNFKKILDNDAELRKTIITDEGNIWGLPMIDKEAQDSFTGPVIRQDWLDDLGLKAPHTIEEWHHVLTQFKTEKNATIPFVIGSQGLPVNDAFIGAYGVKADFFQVDNKIKYGPIEPGYKEYLAEMNKWYNEGLIDRDFPTGGQEVPYMTTGKSGATTNGFWVFEPWETASEDPNMKLVGLPYPVLKEGDKPHFRQNNLRMRGFFTSITTACKNPERAMEFMDYFYTDEGFVLANYGIEGETFEIVDGKYQYTDKMLKNPEGVPMNIALVKYAYSHGAFLRDWHREDNAFPADALAACKVWQNSGDADYMMPPITLTAEEGVEYSNVMGDISTYVDEMRLKFIMGVEPLDKFEDYVQQIKKMNLQRAIEIQQTALDRYNAK